MKRVVFKDVVKRANTKEDRFNTSKKYYVGGEHIDSEELLVSKKGLIEGSTIGPMFYFGFKSGQVLFVTRNPHLKKASMVEFDGICSEKTFVLETKDEKVLLQNFLPILMQTDHFWQYCEEHKSGGVNFFINWSTIADYEFDLPTLEEQKQISDKVWAAYRLKESYKKLLTAIDDMIKSQFIEMFGNAPIGKLRDVSLRSGEYGSNTPATDFDGKTRYVRITDITDEGLLNSDTKSPVLIDEKYLLNDYDVVFARTGNTVGKTYIHQGGRMIFAGYLIRYRMDVNKMLPNFLFSYTHTDAYYQWVDKTKKVGAQPNISATQYDCMPIPIPSIEAQKQFVDIARQADKSKFELRKSIKAIDKVIKSLINNQ